MHTHDGTLRLFIKIVSILLIGIAAYLVIFHGIGSIGSSPATSITTTTPATATSTLSTSTPVEASTSTIVATNPAPTKSVPPPATTQPTKPASPTVPLSSITITNADNGQTVYLAQGQAFTIDYGSSLHWSYAFDPEGIVTAAPGTDAGTAGTYIATTSGTTTLRATGAPICKPDQACPMFVAESMVTLVVR